MKTRSRMIAGVALAAFAALPALSAAQDAPAAAVAAPARGAAGAARGGPGARDNAQPAAATLAAAPADSRLADAAARRDGAAVQRLLKAGRIDLNARAADGSGALHWAVRYGNLDMARALIKAGADVKQANLYDLSPLTLAARNGAVEMIRLLIDAGADANATDSAGETALMAASREGTPAAAALLIERGTKVDGKESTFGQTALMIAARDDRPAIVDLLIKHGADVNARTRIGPAPAPRPPGAGGGSHGEGIVRGGIPPQGARAAQPGGMSPLLYAARDGRLESAKLLIDAGAKIDLADANGLTPLLMALLNDKLTTAQLLIARGADVNAHDWYGRTPLWSAVEVRNLEVNGPKKDNGVDRPLALQLVKTLLDKGADANARTKEYPPDRRFIMGLGSLAWVDFTGQTPFLHAALAGDVETMKLLLQYKADPNITTFNGTTALAAAAGVNWVQNQTWTEGPDRLLEAVKMCVDLGQDVNAVNEMGLAPLHGAANRGSDEIIRYLVSKGAKVDAKDKVGRTPLVWAGGVFLASNAAEPKPTTMALLKGMTAAATPPAPAKPASVARNGK